MTQRGTETVMDEALRVIGVAHLYLCADSDDPRAVPVWITAPPPARHHNLFALVGGRNPDDSGFALSDGSFASRSKAAAVAISAGQVEADRMTVPGKLFSEDLW